MTLNQAPQTFEEWLASINSTGNVAVSAEAAFAAGVASQQAEIRAMHDGILDMETDREVEHALRLRYEEVVEAARAYLRAKAALKWKQGEPNQVETAHVALCVALAALDSPL